MSSEGPISLMDYVKKASAHVKIGEQEKAGTLNRFFSNNPAAGKDGVTKSIPEELLGGNAKEFFEQFQALGNQVVQALEKGEAVPASVFSDMDKLLTKLDEDLKSDKAWNEYWQQIKEKENLTDEDILRSQAEMLGAYRMRVISSSQLKLDKTVSERIVEIGRIRGDKKNPISKEKDEELAKELEPLNKKFAMLKVFTDMNLKINAAHRDVKEGETIFEHVKERYGNKFNSQMAAKFGHLINGLIDKAMQMKKEGKPESEIKQFISQENEKIRNEMLRATGTGADNFPQIFGVEEAKKEYAKVYNTDAFYSKLEKTEELEKVVQEKLGISVAELREKIGNIHSRGTDSSHKEYFEQLMNDIDGIKHFAAKSQTKEDMDKAFERINNKINNKEEFDKTFNEYDRDSALYVAKKAVETLSESKRQKDEKGETFELKDVIELQSNRAIAAVYQDIKDGKIEIKATSSEEYKKAVDELINKKLMEVLPNYMISALENNDKAAISAGMKAFRGNVEFKDVVGPKMEEYAKKLKESVANIISDQGKKEDVTSLINYANELKLGTLITKDEVNNIKTSKYTRNWRTAFGDSFKALREGRFRDIFKKPKRSFKEIEDLGVAKNEGIKSYANDIVKMDEIPDTKREVDLSLSLGTLEESSKEQNLINKQIENLRALGETKHFGEPTFAQKWIAVLYNKLDTDKKLDENQQRALIKAIETLNSPDIPKSASPDDGVWETMVKPRVQQIVNGLIDQKIEEGPVVDMLLELTSGKSPTPQDLVQRLTSVLERAQEEPRTVPDPLENQSHTYLGSEKSGQAKMRDVADKWIEQLRDVERSCDPESDDRKAVRDFMSALNSIEKYTNTTEFDKALNERISIIVSDYKGIDPKLLEKFNEIRTAMREGKEPKLDGLDGLAMQWKDHLQSAMNDLQEGPDKKAVSLVIKVLDDKRSRVSSSELNLSIEEVKRAYGEKVDDKTMSLINKVQEGIRTDKPPKSEKRSSLSV